MDVGCASQDYIEAELNENTNWAAKNRSKPGTGGLGLTKSTDPSVALGHENPQVFVPGNHSGSRTSCRATRPRGPARINNAFTNEPEDGKSNGTLPPGSYEYAITDDFVNPPSGGQSTPSVTPALTVTDGRIGDPAVGGDLSRLGLPDLSRDGRQQQMDADRHGPEPQSATLADRAPRTRIDDQRERWRGDRTVLHRHRRHGHRRRPTAGDEHRRRVADGSRTPTSSPRSRPLASRRSGRRVQGLPESPRSPVWDRVNYAGRESAPSETFLDGTAQVVPRHPTNVYYNASTEAQEVDEYNTLYTPVSRGRPVRSQLDDDLRDITGELRRSHQRRRHAHVPVRDGQRPATELCPPDRTYSANRRPGRNDGHPAKHA